MSFCLFELCKNPEIQLKIQEELDLELGDNFDDVTYESINGLKYLESCIDETLRLYPPLSIMFRRCTRDYKIPNTDLFIEKGTSVFIPAVAMQRDENIYDDPLQFKPERFLDSPNGNGHANGLFYLPFGAGARHCIGERMAKIQTKIGLACILSKYNIEFNDKNQFPDHPEFLKTQFFLRSAEPFNFRVVERSR